MLSPTCLPLQSSPLSPPGPLLLGPSLCSFLPSPAANTCSGSGRTAESGHLRAGSRVPAARLPGGGARGCCPRRRRRGGADEVAMVMELRSCPLSAQQLPGRGLLWAAPVKRAGWQGCQHGERDSPPPLKKGKDRGPAPAPLSSRPLALLTSAPLLLSFPRRDAARPRRTARSAPSRPGEPFLPPPAGPAPRSPAQRPEAARPAGRRGARFPSLSPPRGDSATGARGPGSLPGSQTPPARSAGLRGRKQADPTPTGPRQPVVAASMLSLRSGGALPNWKMGMQEK